MKLDMIAFEAEMKRLRSAYIIDIAPAIEMYRAALARVAELESQLAAQQWRPVTEDWPPYGVQHLGRGMLNSPTLLVTRTTDDSDEVWQDSDGMLFYAREIRYCAAIPEARPLPPAPQETE